MPVRSSVVLSLLLIVFVFGCGERKEGAGSTAVTESPQKLEEQQIQATLTEVIERWRCNDHGALYDNEFPYLRAKENFDQYLKHREIQFKADTVASLTAKQFQFFGHDSAKVTVEELFKGPPDKAVRREKVYSFYYSQGRWIRPSLSSYKLQQEYDETRRQADSAAEAEERESSGQ